MSGIVAGGKSGKTPGRNLPTHSVVNLLNSLVSINQYRYISNPPSCSLLSHGYKESFSIMVVYCVADPSEIRDLVLF